MPNNRPAHNRTDETGNRYGTLTVIKFSHSDGKKAYWLCRCDCGAEVPVRSGQLRRKDARKTQTCAACARKNATRHGHTTGKQSPTFVTWNSMLYRVKHNRYYTAKGVTVCPEWQDFAAFLADMGERPGTAYTLDRIDNNGPYCKANCRWATKAEQARNKSSNVYVTIGDETLVASDWLKRLRLSVGTYNDRRARGMSPYEALTAEKGKRNPKP